MIKKQLAVCGLLTALLITMAMPVVADRAAAVSPAAHVATAGHAHAALLDKTRFLLHMGFAYFAFHHFVYDRFHAKQTQADGTTYVNLFAKGQPHRTANLVKAAVALVFMVHELKVSYKIAKDSHSGTLHALIAPLAGLSGLATTVYAKLRGCQAGSASSAEATPTALPTPDALPTPGATAVASGGCQYSDKDITSVNDAVNSFSTVSSKNGYTVKDQAFPIPGA